VPNPATASQLMLRHTKQISLYLKHPHNAIYRPTQNNRIRRHIGYDNGISAY